MSTKITPNMWIDKMQGKTCNKDNNGPIFRTMNASGRIYISHIHSPRTAPASADEKAQRERFKATVAAVRTVMSDPQKIRTYVAEFRSQKRYATLRGYIFAQEMKKL